MARNSVVVCALLTFTLAAAGFIVTEAYGLNKETGMKDKTIVAVLERHKVGLMALPGVVGVAEGLCDGESCIKVYVTEKTPGIAAKIPHRLEGFPVSVEETGEFKPLKKSD